MLILKEIQSKSRICNIPLPPEGKIAASCGVSRTTVRHAINELIREGWLYQDQAKCTFVVDHCNAYSITAHLENNGISAQWRGNELRAEVLEFSLSPASANTVSHSAGEAGFSTSRIVKRIFCDDHPAAVFYLYRACISGHPAAVHRVINSVRTMQAGPEDSKLLMLDQGVPLSEVVSISFNAGGTVIEYSLSRYCPSLCKVEVKNLNPSDAL